MNMNIFNYLLYIHNTTRGVVRMISFLLIFDVSCVSDVWRLRDEVQLLRIFE